MSFSQAMNDVRARARQGIIGAWVLLSALNRYATGWNKDPQAKQVSTITVNTAADDTKYAVTINGVEVTYTSGTGATTTSIATGLAAAINEEPLVRGQVSATSSAAVVTLTGTYPGEAFTLTESDANLSTATTTSADEADPIGFGRAVVSDGFVTDEGELQVRIAKTANFSAQVATLGLTYIAAAEVVVAVYEVRGEERHLLAQASHAMATDLDTSITALAARLNALLPANSVNVTEDGTDITFTAEIAGLEFAVEVGVSAEGVSPDLAQTTGPSRSTSLHRALAGISLHSEIDPAAAIAGTEGEYAANAGVLMAQSGQLWVASSQAPTEGGVVYVELDGSGDNAGKFYTTSSSTRVALARSMARWVRDGVNTSDGLAALRISL